MAARGPVAVRAFAGAGELTPRRAARRPRPLAAPERPRRLARGARRGRPEARRGGGRGRHRAPSATSSSASRTATATARSVPLATLEPGETGDRPGRGARQPPRPFRRRRPHDHSASKSATRAATCGRPGSTSPGSPRSSTRARSSCSPASAPTNAASASASGSWSRPGRDEAGRTPGRRIRSGSAAELVPVHPATEALRAAADPRLGRAGDAAGRRTRSRGCRRSCGRAAGSAGVGDAIRAAHFPESQRGSRGARASGSRFEELFLYQAILATRKRTPPRRPAGAAARQAGGAGRALDRVAAVRADRATSCAAFDEIDADLDSGEPMQRLLMGEVGSGKTVVAALRDAAGARSRLPGGADGADRDARRAARDHPRPAARRRGDRRSRC